MPSLRFRPRPLRRQPCTTSRRRWTAATWRCARSRRRPARAGRRWRPHTQQVGQTGTKITPDLYLACGISGAIQHFAGCSGAKAIIAVNTDPAAPMMTRADYAVIGDLHEVLPALIEALRARLDGA